MRYTLIGAPKIANNPMGLPRHGKNQLKRNGWLNYIVTRCPSRENCDLSLGW